MTLPTTRPSTRVPAFEDQLTGELGAFAQEADDVGTLAPSRPRSRHFAMCRASPGLAPRCALDAAPQDMSDRRANIGRNAAWVVSGGIRSGPSRWCPVRPGFDFITVIPVPTW